MSVNGYSNKLIAIDDEMVSIGRPPPPVVSWLSGGLKGDLNQRTKAWREQLDTWEDANPEKAARWLELLVSYEAELEVERRVVFDGTEDAWNYALLEQIGVPRSNVDTIKGAFQDNASMRAASEWARYGTSWSLLLIGGTGCGKSTAAAWAGHQMLMRRLRPVWVDCFKQCEAPLYGVAAEHLRFKCRTSPVLVLDDLGGGQRERESKFWLAWLDDVIGTRANENRKTIITTNRNPDELKAWLGARLVDRLSSGTIHSTSEKSMRRAA